MNPDSNVIGYSPDVSVLNSIAVHMCNNVPLVWLKYLTYCELITDYLIHDLIPFKMSVPVATWSKA